MRAGVVTITLICLVALALLGHALPSDALGEEEWHTISTEDGVTGIQNGGMDVRDLGELQTAPVWRTRVEWFTGIAAFS